MLTHTHIIGETLNQVHFSRKRPCEKVTKCDVHTPSYHIISFVKAPLIQRHNIQLVQNKK